MTEAYAELLADARADARAEAWDEAHPADMECSECGAIWWGNWTGLRGLDPPEARHPDCPRCEL